MAVSLDVWSLLRKYYPENQYALLAEVRDKAGFSASRSADFISVGLWPSRGLHINGIELKSFRSDWLSELKKPQKAENIFQYCDFFWLLTSEESIAKIEEIPPTWGWMCVSRNRIIVKKDAPKLTPKPVSNHFLAAMLKRASDKTNYIRVDEIEDSIQQARETAKQESERALKDISKELSELRIDVADFNKASGIDLLNYYRWQTSPAKIGEAVRLLTTGGADSIKNELIKLGKAAKNIMNTIDNNVAILDTHKAPELPSSVKTDTD